MAPLTFDEKKVLKKLQNEEKDRLKKLAESRHIYNDNKRNIMMSEEHEVMKT